MLTQVRHCPFTYCIYSVTYYLVSSYGYNGRQIRQRIAQEWVVRWAFYRGAATRTHCRPEPHAQTVTYVR